MKTNSLQPLLGLAIALSSLTSISLGEGLELERLQEARLRRILEIEEIYLAELEKLKVKYTKEGNLEKAIRISGLIIKKRNETGLGLSSLSEMTSKDLAQLPPAGLAFEVPFSKDGLGITKSSGRSLFFPFRLTGQKNIEITIGHGFDNSGDNGLSWRVVDSSAQVTYGSGFTKSKDKKSWVVKNVTSLRPILIIEDKDSNFFDGAPGNGFSVAVEIAD